MDAFDLGSEHPILTGMEAEEILKVAQKIVSTISPTLSASAHPDDALPDRWLTDMTFLAEVEVARHTKHRRNLRDPDYRLAQAVLLMAARERRRKNLKPRLLRRLTTR